MLEHKNKEHLKVLLVVKSEFRDLSKQRLKSHKYIIGLKMSIYLDWEKSQNYKFLKRKIQTYEFQESNIIKID